MTVDESEQKTLLKMARDAIGHGLVHAEAPEVVPDDYVAPLRQIASPSSPCIWTMPCAAASAA